MVKKNVPIVALTVMIAVAGSASAASKADNVVNSQTQVEQQTQVSNQSEDTQIQATTGVGEGSQGQASGQTQTQVEQQTQVSNQGENTQVQTSSGAGDGDRGQVQTQTQGGQQSQVSNQGETNQLRSQEQESVQAENGEDAQMSEQRRIKVASAVQEMLQVAERNEGIGQQVRTIAQTQTQNRERLEMSLEKVQGRGGLVRLLVGPNYGEIKNAERLLEQNREQIQQLDGVMDQMEEEDDKQNLGQQIRTLEQANLEIENSLETEQEGFSLLGWIFKLFA